MVQIATSHIDVQHVIQSVVTDESGGIDVFIGTTRNRSNGRAVTGLEYEAYEAMALKVMDRIERESLDRWPIHKITIVHRVGRVQIGEASVVIAVSAPHRAEAFESCRYIIDRLKQIVPIWKREFFADGTVEWSLQSHRQYPTEIEQ